MVIYIPCLAREGKNHILSSGTTTFKPYEGVHPKPSSPPPLPYLVIFPQMLEDHEIRFVGQYSLIYNFHLTQKFLF